LNRLAPQMMASVTMVVSTTGPTGETCGSDAPSSATTMASTATTTSATETRKASSSQRVVRRAASCRA
jgi:hypothetical protein